MRVKKFLVFASIVTLLGICTLAHATTMLFLTREDLTRRSDVVARVHVGKAMTIESNDGRMILTRTELAVTKLLKGKVDGPLFVQQVGGSANGKTQQIAGDARLRPGEDALVFLRRDDKGKTYLTALSLSVYHVDEKGIARRHLDELVFVKIENGKAKRVAHVEIPEPVESVMTDVVRFAGGH